MIKYREKVAVVGTVVAIVFFLGIAVIGVPQLEAAPIATVSGEINTIDHAAGTINIKKSDGLTMTLYVVSRTKVTRNGATVSLEGLAIRDSVSVKYLASKSVALKVTASGPVVQTVEGDVDQIGLGEGLLTIGSQIVTIGASTKIARNGLVVSLSSITKQDHVVVHVPGATISGSAAAVTAEDVTSDGPESTEVHGTISVVGASSVTINPNNGTAPITLTMGPDTTIEVNGDPATLTNLKVGYEVEAHYDSVTNAAYSIEADSGGGSDDAKVKGIVAAVNSSAGTITITPDGGDGNITLTVIAATEIQVDGQEATIEEIAVGMPVKAEYDTATLVAKEIKAGSGDDEDENDEDAHVAGIVAAVDVNTITITPDGGGATIKLTVDTSTEIEVDGENGTLVMIKPGDPIQAEYYVDTLVAKEIKAGTDDGEDGGDEVKTTGMVTAVGTNTVTIAPDNGSAAITLTVTSSTKIKVNGEDATLADIHAGDPIRAKYELDTLVTKELEVGNTGGEEDVETQGTVTGVSATTVTIAPDNGSTPVTLTVTSETDIEVDGEDGSTADIHVGDPIRAEYELNTLVAKELKVGGSDGWEEKEEVKGTVTAVGTSTVTITPEGGGTAVTLTIDASTKIEVDGEEATLSDIQVGDPIRAEYDPGTLIANEIEVGSGSGGGGELEVKGTVASISSTSVTITPEEGGVPVTLIIDASTHIEIDGENASVDDILVGDQTKAKYDRVTKIAIDIEIDRDKD